MDDVEKELHVHREELVALAQLLGSDYCDGVHGVGVVNAMEALSVFGAADDGLSAFAKWVRAWRGTDAGDEPEEEEGEGLTVDREDEDADSAEARRVRRQAYKQRHRNVRRNWVLPASFPSSTVSTA